jgi:hypothetical protein
MIQIYRSPRSVSSGHMPCPHGTTLGPFPDADPPSCPPEHQALVVDAQSLRRNDAEVMSPVGEFDGSVDQYPAGSSSSARNRTTGASTSIRSVAWHHADHGWNARTAVDHLSQRPAITALRTSNRIPVSRSRYPGTSIIFWARKRSETSSERHGIKKKHTTASSCTGSIIIARCTRTRVDARKVVARSRHAVEGALEAQARKRLDAAKNADAAHVKRKAAPVQDAGMSSLSAVSLEP